MLIILSTVALFFGALLYNITISNIKLRHGLNYTVGLFIIAILVMDVFPESVEHSGALYSSIALAIGFIVILYLDNVLSSNKAHKLAIWLAALGLSIHAITDGIALSDESFLPAAVILHRIPVGAGLWFVLQSKIQTLAVITIISFFTICGFYLGNETLHSLHFSLGIFQAAMCGILAHVVIHNSYSQVLNETSLDH